VTPSAFHIEPRGSGKARRYRAVVYVPVSERKPGEQPRRTSKWRHYEREAKTDGQALLTTLSAGAVTDETVAQLLERWLRDYATGSVEDTTLAHYRRHADFHIKPLLGDIPVAELTPADAAHWQADELTHQSAKSVRNYRGVLGGALSWAVKLGDLEKNVLAQVPAPRWNRRPVEPPPVGALQGYLEALEGSRYYLPALIAGGTGMRRGEVLGLEWRHVDLVEGVIHVRQNVRQVGSEVSVVPYLKTAAGRRDLPLPEFVAAHLRRARLEAQAMIGKVRPNDRLCAAMKPDQLTHGLRAWYVRRDMRPVGMHMMRHAVASAMLASGVPMLEVQGFLGHKNVVTTLGTYGHLMPGALGGAAKRYGEAWEEAEQKRDDPGPGTGGDVVQFRRAK
jgi:integrase